MADSPQELAYRNVNTVIFTIARMNPPTPGHLLLVQKLIEKAIQLNVDDVYIILSRSNEDNENPIACEEKQSVLGEADTISKTMINALKETMVANATTDALKANIAAVKVHTICSSFMFGPLMDIINAKTAAGATDLNLIVFMGEDRKDFIDSIAKFFVVDEKQKWPNVKSIDGIALPREDMAKYKSLAADPITLNDLDLTTVPVNAMSASFVRNIVKNGNETKFMELYAPYLEREKIQTLYHSLQTGLSKPNPKTKSKSEGKLSYTYPLFKGTSVSAVPKLGKTPATKKSRTELAPQVAEELRNVSRSTRSRPRGGKKTRRGKQRSRSKKRSKKKQRSKKQQSRKKQKRST